MSQTHPKVDGFLAKAKAWQPEMTALRALLLDSALTEDFKWYQPCYTAEGGNIVILSGLKDHCWLAFFKGALMADPASLLVKAGENSRFGRVIKFTSVAQIAEHAPLLRGYIADAIAVERSGAKLDPAPNSDQMLPDELLQAMQADPAFHAAFTALTPGRQRGYCLHFAQAKQPATRAARIEKHRARILQGLGINDR